MQILAETEYQNLYRITDGVLLVVNKFKFIDYKKGIGTLYKAKTRSYNKGCQKFLNVLKEDFYYGFADITIPKGTVLYKGKPVELVDKTEWNYQIKTTGDFFSGDANRTLKLLNEIMSKIKE